MHAATEPGDLPKLMELVIGELTRAAYDIEDSELDRARAQFRASLLMSGESAPSRAGQIARQILLFGRPIPNDELLLRLDNLTVGRLRDLAGRIFVESAPTVSAVGPVDTLMEIDDIRGRLVAGAPGERPLHHRRAAVATGGRPIRGVGARVSAARCAIRIETRSRRRVRRADGLLPQPRRSRPCVVRLQKKARAVAGRRTAPGAHGRSRSCERGFPSRDRRPLPGPRHGAGALPFDPRSWRILSRYSLGGLAGPNDPQ